MPLLQYIDNLFPAEANSIDRVPRILSLVKDDRMPCIMMTKAPTVAIPLR